MNASQKATFDLVDKRVVDYLLDNNISDEEEADILDVMTEYKNLVIEGKSPLKSVGKAFRDIIDLHEHKQKKISEAEKLRNKKTWIPLLPQRYIT